MSGVGLMAIEDAAIIGSLTSTSAVLLLFSRSTRFNRSFSEVNCVT